MQLGFLAKDRREAFCLKWIGLGVYLFILSFFFASGPALIRNLFYLFVLLPVVAVIPWRTWRLEEYGGYFTLSALVFAAYSVLASLWGNAENFGFFFKQWVFLAIWLCGVAWLMYHKPINIQRLYMLIITVAMVGALVTVLYFYVYSNNTLGTRLLGLGMIENSTVVAQIYGVAGLLAYIKSLQAKKLTISLGFLVASLICCLPILFSQTRGAALALIVSVCLSLWLLKPRLLIWGMQLMLAAIGVAALFWALDFVAVLEQRGISFSMRDVIWRDVLQRGLEHPLFGIGYEQNSRITLTNGDIYHHAHNSWVDIFYYCGLVGLLLAVWHGLLMVRSFVRDENIMPLYIWWIFGCLCLMTNGSSLLTRPDDQWFMYWVPAGLLAGLVMRHRRGLS
ncbi:O-antigen ligase family protein [Cellvibrio sp. NN19]|uniref:O-antigen ligase family protein n=1 Tax=Cellvibrio chitinivorans TaxID=3102792 RepID=UPI002B40C59C|nr:O-antigen ligase family protein [Cellvibrio sp. NN19]